jgi:uncharacterized membrane protein
MPIVIWFSLLVFIVLVLLLPLAFGELLVDGLAKPHLTPSAAVVLVIGMVVGGFINIPVKRLVRSEQVSVHPLAVLGLSSMWPQMQRTHHQTVIAVNVGGCLIPTALAVYQLAHKLSWRWRLPAPLTVLPVTLWPDRSLVSGSCCPAEYRH